jgi:hypothetical protein
VRKRRDECVREMRERQNIAEEQQFTSRMSCGEEGTTAIGLIRPECRVQK